jgi:hypothetical protein
MYLIAVTAVFFLVFGGCFLKLFTMVDEWFKIQRAEIRTQLFFVIFPSAMGVPQELDGL